MAFRKLDVFGYYKFVTAVKNINLLPDRSNMMKQKKMKAISGFAFKGAVGLVAGIYLILFGMSFWNIYIYNKKLVNYAKVKVEHAKSVKQKKISKRGCEKNISNNKFINYLLEFTLNLLNNIS